MVLVASLVVSVMIAAAQVKTCRPNRVEPSTGSKPSGCGTVILKKKKKKKKIFNDGVNMFKFVEWVRDPVLDDILIYSKTKAEHLSHIRSVLALLRSGLLSVLAYSNGH
jgi:hypothetical protein